MSLLRRIVFSPVTGFGLTIGLFHLLRDVFGGHPHSWYGALGFLALFAYGCGLLLILLLFGSGWYPALKKLTFPSAMEHPVYKSCMGCASVLSNGPYLSATLLIFIVPSATLLTFITTLSAVATIAASATFLRDPSTPVT